jgi:hypothetical protein
MPELGQKEIFLFFVKHYGLQSFTFVNVGFMKVMVIVIHFLPKYAPHFSYHRPQSQHPLNTTWHH